MERFDLCTEQDVILLREGAADFERKDLLFERCLPGHTLRLRRGAQQMLAFADLIEQHLDSRMLLAS